MQWNLSTTPPVHCNHWAVLNNPDVNICLSLAADIVLEASIFEVSKNIASTLDQSLSQQERESLCQQFTAINAKRLPFSNPTASSLANNSSTSELDDDGLCEADDLAEIISGNEDRKMGIREDIRGFPKGALKMVSMYALSSFSSTTPLKYTMQLDPTHQHHHLLPLPPNSTWRRLKNQETAHWVPCSSSS